VTALVENKKALLVVTTHGVDPIKLVVFLLALCCKMMVLYHHEKARLGQLVHRKTRTTVVFTQVDSEGRVLWLHWWKP
ncbi:ribosomal L7Ae/L30e/S12e/Gadd45 family protein, partial [Klebsiella pneumoniae]|nr:ribosomal L7Ae/L30e/S12e/Gadd45 family protein [Klebsiella pneumoniae]